MSADDVISSFLLPLAAARAAAADLDAAITRALGRLQARGIPTAPLQVELEDLGVRELWGDLRYVGRVTVRGALPAVPGVDLLGEVHRLTTDDGEAVAIARAYGPDLPRDLCTLDAHGGLPCDHCQVSRRRASVYVVRDAGGRVLRLGGDCLEGAKYGLLPALSAALSAIHGAISAAEGDGEEGGLGGRAADGLYARDWLIEVCATIARHGWTSGRRAWAYEVPSTAQLASAAIERRAHGKPTPRPTREDVAEAAAVRAWLAGLELGTDDPYMSSLAALGRVSFWPSELLGLAASAVPAYHRALLAELPAPVAFVPRARSQKPASRRKNAPMVDVEGTFVVERAVCVRAIETVGTYGPRIGYVFHALAEGAELVWWTGSVPRDLVPLAEGDEDLTTIEGDEGQRGEDLTTIEGVRYRRVPTFRPGRIVRLEGKIKRDGEYRGRPNTTVTHLDVRPVAEPAAAAEEVAPAAAHG